MGKKTKKVQKEEKEVKEDKKEEKEDKPKRSKVDTSVDLKDIFSESFRERLSQYISLNEEVLTLKSTVEGSDQSDHINERKVQMATRVEEAAANILRDELVSLEEWIGRQQEKLSDDIIKISTAYDQNKKSLLSTGAFNEAEVNSSLDSIQKKSNQKQAIYDSYSSLLQRSKHIYS